MNFKNELRIFTSILLLVGIFGFMFVDNYFGGVFISAGILFGIYSILTKEEENEPIRP